MLPPGQAAALYYNSLGAGYLVITDGLNHSEGKDHPVKYFIVNKIFDALGIKDLNIFGTIFGRNL